VEVGGQWCEEPEGVRREAKALFEKRFTTTQEFGVNLGFVEFKSLPAKVSIRMVDNFTEEEVKEAVWQCEGSKSSGPDRFNFTFIKNCWDYLKYDIMEALYLFQETGDIPKGCNASFIALVPKVNDPLSLKQFRPISLVGIFYKIVTKVLAGRMKEVLALVIDEHQYVFLRNKGLLDSVLIANEVVEEVRRNRRSALCFKVDYEKAYDSVKWNFLLDMLHKLGFHSKWIKWVTGCLKSSSISVLVNGSPTEEFKPLRGLRQGDPLFPFLFLVVAEGLAGLVRQASKQNMLTGVKVGRDIECSMLQFAYDTLFMCEDSFSNIFSIKTILRCFELVSGLKINFHKLKLVGINVDRYTLETYVKTLNCNTMQIPLKYLGLEIGGNPGKALFWEPVINKINARLSSWKGKFLSMAGRICLIKSVFTFIPLFYLSFFKAPASVCNKIKSIQRSFLWAWGRDNRSIPWVSWENICKPCEEGGLGIKDMRKFNFALMAKWKWRLMNEEEGKWKDILKSKYIAISSNTHGQMKKQSRWWSDLLKICREGEGEGWFQKALVWKVRSSDSIRLWKDPWVNNNNLKDLYPRLYTLSLHQGMTVGETGFWGEGGWQWNLKWRRERFQWELGLEEELLTVLDKEVLYKDVKDLITWRGDSKGIFIVKSTYSLLTNQDTGPSSDVFSLLWKTKAVPKVMITAWRILLDKIPTRRNLESRGIIVNSSLCVLCNMAEETTQHLFLDCIFVHHVWMLCCRWIGIFGVQNKDIGSHFANFHLVHMSEKQNQVWKEVWAAILRCIWEHRNNVIFRQGVPDSEEIFQVAQLLSWLWLKHREGSFSYSFSDWHLNPNECLLCIR